MRVVLDSKLRVPLDAEVLRPDAATSERSDPERRTALRERGVKVDVVARLGRRLSLPDTFARLLAAGPDSVLIEGESRTITSVLAAGLVDRMIVSIAPTVIGTGTQAIDDLGTQRIADGNRPGNRVIFPVGDDVVLAWDVAAS